MNMEGNLFTVSSRKYFQKKSLETRQEDREEKGKLEKKNKREYKELNLAERNT